MLRSFVILALLNCLLWDISHAYVLTKQKESFTCPAIDGFYTVSGKCAAEYYVCVGGESFLQKCPGMGNVFDSSVSRCLSLTSASCRAIGTTTEAGTTKTTRNVGTDATTTGESTFNCPSSEGFYPIPGTCSPDYIVCVSGSPYVTTCPSGSVFDPETNVCTSIESASCQAEFQCPNPDGFFAVPGACDGNYYSCVGGQAYLQQCPGTSIFDPETSTCVAESSASCKTTTTPTTTSSTTTSTTTTSPTTTTTSPTTTTTSPTTTTTTTTTTTSTPTTPSFVCPGTGQYPYPGSCNLYYVCSGSNYIIASCPAGQVFNPETQFCENPGNVPGCDFNIIKFYRDQKFVGITGSSFQ